MITVKVADKNGTDFMNMESVLSQLHLRTFSTINEKVMVLYGEMLGRRKSAISRQRSTGAEDGEFKGHVSLSVFHIFFNLMHEHRIHGFLNRRNDVKHGIQLRYFDKFHRVIGEGGKDKHATIFLKDTITN